MIDALAKQVIADCQTHGLQFVTAESCTGGLIMASMTDISGASAVCDRAYVTYSNTAKQEMLGVQADTLAIYGAVSAETAYEMVTGAAQTLSVPHAAISVTGIAGPGGGSAEKPVGTVLIGTAISGTQTLTKGYLFAGDRAAIRHQTIIAALEQLHSHMVPQD